MEKEKILTELESILKKIHLTKHFIECNNHVMQVNNGQEAMVEVIENQVTLLYEQIKESMNE